MVVEQWIWAVSKHHDVFFCSQGLREKSGVQEIRVPPHTMSCPPVAQSCRNQGEGGARGAIDRSDRVGFWAKTAEPQPIGMRNGHLHFEQRQPPAPARPLLVELRDCKQAPNKTHCDFPFGETFANEMQLLFVVGSVDPRLKLQVESNRHTSARRAPGRTSPAAFACAAAPQGVVPERASDIPLLFSLRRLYAAVCTRVAREAERTREFLGCRAAEKSGAQRLSSQQMLLAPPCFRAFQQLWILHWPLARRVRNTRMFAFPGRDGISTLNSDY